MIKKLAFLLLFLQPGVAVSAPLETFSTFVTANPYSSKNGQWTQMLMRGIGTNDFYVMEVNPTTGAIPVSGTFTLSLDTNYGVVGANTLRSAAQIGNATGAADFNFGAPGAQTLRSAAMLGVGSTAVSTSNPVPTSQTVAAVTWQTEGAIAAASLTTSFATAFTTGGVLVWIGLRNNTDGTVVVSLDGGSTSAFTLDSGDQISLDLKPQGKSIAGSVAIQAKYTGSAPTTGTFRVNGYY